MNIIPNENYQYKVNFSEKEVMARVSKLPHYQFHENKFGINKGFGFFQKSTLIGFVERIDDETIVNVKIKMDSGLSAFLYIILGFCALGLTISVFQSFSKDAFMWEGILGSLGFGIFAYVFYIVFYLVDSTQKLSELKKILMIK